MERFIWLAKQAKLHLSSAPACSLIILQTDTKLLYPQSSYFLFSQREQQKVTLYIFYNYVSALFLPRAVLQGRRVCGQYVAIKEMGWRGCLKIRDVIGRHGS
jgi:hypothetical protein